MSRFLSDLLGAREPAFTQHINRLEQESGNPSIDIRLASDVAKKVRQKLRELGLDPKDTNGCELYYGLQGLVKMHDEYLAKSLGTKANDAQSVINRAVAIIPKLQIPQTCWALKHSTVKRLLKKLPPKHVMKQLRYRSVDSLLKRADIDEVMAAIYFAESASWLERFINAYKHLEPSDFETRQISVIELNSKKWGSLTEKYLETKHHNIIRVNEMGVVAVLPLPVSDMPGLAITLLPLIIYHLNKIRCVSTYLKLNQVKPMFGSQFAQAISAPLKGTATLYGRPLSWETIHKHFGRSGSQTHPEVFEPHVQPEDLSWRQAEDVLYKLEPALKFWEGLDYVAAPFKKLPVSLSLLDNAVSYCNQLSYGEQSVQYFRESLRRELFMRYLERQKLEEHITQQFDTGLQEVDMFAVIERGWR